MNVRTFDNVNTEKNHGWKHGDGTVAIGNPRFGQVFHVWMCDDEGNPLYDAILRAESGGGVFLPIDTEGRIGLQQVERPQTTDQEAWTAAWPDVNIESVGRTGWEIPRGFAQVGESGENAAVREAQEETGSVVTSAELLGQVVDNTACSPHFTSVQLGSVDLSRRSDSVQDPNERIVRKLQFFTREEVKGLIETGELYCAYTLSAIALWLLR